MNTQDQRRARRVQIVRPCKVYHWPTRRYWPGQTRDVSSGGALLQIDSPRPMKPGDKIEVAIAWSQRVLLSASDQIEASISRVMTSDDGAQLVAVEFNRASGLLEAA